MLIDSEMMIPFEEGDLRRISRLVDTKGAAVIVENDAPRYLVLDFQQVEEERQIADEDLMALARKLMEKNLEAYRELAK